MLRNYPKDPALRQVKGIFLLKKDEENSTEKTIELLKSMHCQILQQSDDRMTIKTSRGNLQKIKQCWLDNDADNDLSRKLNERVSQIIIGGNA